MEKSMSQVKIARVKGKIKTLQESHLKAKVKDFCASDFLAPMSLLAEGEYSFSSKKNAKVVITDLRTGEFKGECSDLLFKKRVTKF